MASSSLNPSAIQSRQWIMDSLINLMEKKEWSDISISEIATNAGVVRRTFYRHFDSKEDVLQAYLDGLVNIFVEALLKEPDLDTVASLRILFTILKKNKKFSNSIDLDQADYLEVKEETMPSVMQARQIIECIRQLPLGYRTVLNLYAMEGYSHKEIADMLDIEESTSRSQYTRAKVMLEGILIKKRIIEQPRERFNWAAAFKK